MLSSVRKYANGFNFRNTYWENLMRVCWDILIEVPPTSYLRWQNNWIETIFLDIIHGKVFFLHAVIHAATSWHLRRGEKCWNKFCIIKWLQLVLKNLKFWGDNCPVPRYRNKPHLWIGYGFVIMMALQSIAMPEQSTV